MWLEVIADASNAEVESWRLWELGAVAVEERPTPGGEVLFVAGFPDADTLGAAKVAMGDAAVVCHGDGAWREAWKQFAQSYVVSERIAVVPSWVEPVGLPDGAAAVVIDPGAAFGFEHATTKACLALLVDHVRAGSSVLDVGCGSGILAVAAARLGAARVVACDIDPIAVATTRANAQRNAVTVQTRGGTVGSEADPFDVVVANLGGAQVIVESAAALVAATARGGVLVVGGLLAGHDGPALAALHEAAPGARISPHDTDPWRTVVVRLPG